MNVSLQDQWSFFLPALLESDRISHGAPTIPEGECEHLVTMLEEVVASIRLTSEYRRDLRGLCPNGFPHLNELSDETVEQCLTQGLNSLPDSELALLTINPLAILQLHEALHDDDFSNHIPEVWWDVFRRTGSRRMADAGLTVPPVESLIRASTDRQDAADTESFVTPAASTSQADRPAAARRAVSQAMGRSQAMSDGPVLTSAFPEWTFDVPVNDSQRYQSQGAPVPPDAEPVKLVVTWQSASRLRVAYPAEGGFLKLDPGTTLADIEWSDAAGRPKGTGSQSNPFVGHVDVPPNGEQPSTGDRIKFTYQNKAGWQLEVTVTIP